MATRRGAAWFLALGSWLASGAAVGADAVKLERWAVEGTMIRGEGMGADLVLLVAEVSWRADAPRDPAKYAIKVTLPDGLVVTRVFPVDYPPGRRRCVVYIPAGTLRNRQPADAKAGVTVVDASTGVAVSNTLDATINDFPRPIGDASATDLGPFGSGKPLDGDDGTLPTPGPDGLKFSRIKDLPGFYLATTESTNKQVLARLPGYDPKLGRSDEFTLEGPDQPALGLTPARAVDYLKGLTAADPAGPTYRLPTRDEWIKAAKGGKSTVFWWGDDPKKVDVANLVGPEPGLQVDSTGASQPPLSGLGFEANPFGLYHMIGNVAEWATDPNGGFARMGGHFRTEPASPLPDVAVAKDDEVGPDPFVGVRAAFSLTPEAGTAIVKKQLEADPRLARVSVAYDPDRATVTLGGPVPDATSRREADRLARGLWFVACVADSLETPKLATGQLAILGEPVGPMKKTAALGRSFVEVTLPVRWLDPLPVSGSDWYVNAYLPGGGHVAHKLVEGEAGRSSKAKVVIDRALMTDDGLGFSVAISLGSPSPSSTDRNVVSNVVKVGPVLKKAGTP